MNKNKSFVQDVFTLTSVPIISQILGILLTPIVTRMYAPEAFGLANLLGSAVMILAVFSTMGYHGAIILPKNDSTATSIVMVCFFFIFCVTAISFLIMMVGKDIIAAKLEAPSLANYLWLTPIFVFSYGLYMTLRYWKTRLRRFDGLAVSRISEIVGRKTYQIAAGYLGFATSGSLIYSDLATGIVKNLVLMRGLGLKTTGFKKKTYLKLIAVAIRYKKFPQFNVWSDLFSRLPAIIISFFIFKYFGQAMLGYYGLSLMVLSMPSILITGSINEALAPRVAMAKHENKHTELLEKIYVRLVAIMIFPFIVLGTLGDRLFLILFGSEWIQSGIIAQILVFRIFFEIVFSPLISMIDIMGKQELNIIRTVASSVISVSALGLGAYYDNFYLALWCLALFEGVLITILGGHMMRLIHFSFLYAIKKLARFILIAVFLGGTIFVTEDLFFANDLYLVAIICTVFLIYYAFLAYLDRDLMNMFIKIFKTSD